MKRIGYGQVEPNHLSAQRNGKIYAQLPSPLNLIENGMFLKCDWVASQGTSTGASQADIIGNGEWLLVYNEVKTYDARETYKDFALKKEDAVGGQGNLYPRLFKTDIGDIITTNCIGRYGNKDETPARGKYVVVGENGYLEAADTKGDGMAWLVIEVTTMPDGQEAVKIVRVQ